MSDPIPFTFAVSVVERMQLVAGDLLVLSTEAFLTDDMIARLETHMQTALPAGVRVAVLDGGLSVDVIIGKDQK